MSQTIASKTWSRITGEGLFKVTAAVEYIEGNDGPYFSITGELWARKRMVACRLHDEISRYFPEVEKYIKWHLFGLSMLGRGREPMHYIANSLYWAGYTEWQSYNITNLGKTAIIGAIDVDKKIDFEELVNVPGLSSDEILVRQERLEYVLKQRLPALQKAFDTDIAKLFGINFVGGWHK